MNRLWDQYRGLSKDIYILFIGRVVSAMGTFIWPMMTLILSAKFHYDAVTIASITVVGGFLIIPAVLIGGKLSDKIGRKKVLLFSNYMMVLGYWINGLLPLGIHTIVLFFISGFFGNMGNPASNALIADKSSSHDREKAYSLSYLGWNLGFILGPSIGGFLFKDFLNLAFIIDGTTTLIGTLLIHIYIQEKRIEDDEVVNSVYESAQDHLSTWQIIKSNPTLWLYLTVMSLYGLMYMQSNFLLPLQLQSVTDKFSELYGLLYSFNGLIVIVFTPILTLKLKRTLEIDRFSLGNLMLMGSFVLYALFYQTIWVFALGMFLFTLGEITYTISNAAYFTRRIPSSHRGRIDASLGLVAQMMIGLGQFAFSFLLKIVSYHQAWFFILGLGALVMMLTPIFKRVDQKRYPLLVQDEF